MTTRYVKAIATKIFAAASFVSLTMSKIALKLFLFAYRILFWPASIVIGINSGMALFDARLIEALIGAAAVAVLVALYFGLPALVPMLNDEIARTKKALVRPMTYKSRMKYTLG